MNTRMILLAALALSATLATACSKDTSTSASTQKADAAASAITVSLLPPDAGTDASSVPMGTLKNYFPRDGVGGYRRVVHSTVRDGYAEAALEKDGKDVAVLSISDAERMAYAKAKFEKATETLDGSPLLTEGKDLSTILVKGRFEIKVFSRTLDADARKAILSAFDLKGLASQT